MYKLLNSAVMPKPGHYYVVPLTVAEFAARLREGFTSYVGYPATADHISQVAGVRVPLSRDPVDLQHGDQALVCRLKYRLADPTQKANKDFVPSAEDYEYLLVTYHEQDPYAPVVSVARKLRDLMRAGAGESIAEVSNYLTQLGKLLRQLADALDEVER
ncbi:MAG: DUF1874 domain-containing protein [Anaerolineae bacterium]|nr:DUF1874 domain-containing protein [Anaerolineae bacterium]